MPRFLERNLQMDYEFFTKTALFQGASKDEISAMLRCLNARTKNFSKGEYILRTGETADCVGLVLAGSVTIENDDIWGNRSILIHIGTGEIFAETYACIPGERLMINAIANEDTKILFLNISQILQTCPRSCAHHTTMIRNLLQISAQKNLALSRRILHTSSKSIRGRLLSYFSQQILQTGSRKFTIPFNRQQLADYLNVDRSALSSELSKMQKEGILTYKKNQFSLNE